MLPLPFSKMEKGREGKTAQGPGGQEGCRESGWLPQPAPGAMRLYRAVDSHSFICSVTDPASI